MRQVYLGAVAVTACLAWVAPLEASPFSSVDATTTCLTGRSQQFCVLTGTMLGPKHQALPESLADISSITTLIGEAEGPVFDRSAALTVDTFADETYAPLVVGPQMMASVQLSFDSRVDIAGRKIGVESFFAARRQPLTARRTVGLDTMQLELTLASALPTLGAEKSVSERALSKSDYVSFALVNQAHVSMQPAPSPAAEESEEEEASLQ
jgi:hypothetical protein